MTIWGWCVCAAMALAIILLIIKLRLMQKSTDEIIAAFSERLSEDTNTLIDISSHDRHMRTLASEINVQLRKLRHERHRYIQGDNELKEAVTNISHDLRTPLTAICGYLELLKKEDKSPDAARYLEMIANRTEALKDLIEELFRYSVMASVKDEAAEPVVINDVLEESLAAAYGALTEREITPEIYITETPVERTLNRSALSRIFGNIISNALKYSDGNFSVSLEDSGTVVFSNTAANLTPVTVGRLFDRFYTVETGRSSTGLGLSIAKLLTERMGGKVEADYIDNQLVITVKFQ